MTAREWLVYWLSTYEAGMINSYADLKDSLLDVTHDELSYTHSQGLKRFKRYDHARRERLLLDVLRS